MRRNENLGRCRSADSLSAKLNASTSGLSMQLINQIRRQSFPLQNRNRPNVQPSYSDVNCTPEMFQPGYQGPAQQYSPSQFGLSPNEQFQHPRMFRNLQYQTDQPAMEALQAGQPRRSLFQQRAPHFSDLPSECLEDFSDPSFNITDSQISNLTDECLGDMTMPSIVSDDKLYSRTPLPSQNLDDESCPDLCNESIPSPIRISSALRRARQKSLPDECLDDVSQPSFARSPSPSPVRRSPSPQPCPPSPQECLENLSPPPNWPSIPPSPSPQGQQFNYALPPSPPRSPRIRSPLPDECLGDVSAPSFCPSGSPTPRRRTPLQLPAECLENMSAPSMYSGGSTTGASSSRMPSGLLDDISQPSLCNMSIPSPIRISPPQRTPLPLERLDDVSAPSFASPPSRASTPGRTSQPSMLDCTYNDILLRFNCLKQRVMCNVASSPKPPSPSPRRSPSPCPSPQDAGSPGILNESDMPIDDVFGADQVEPPPQCIRETVIERTANENGCIEKIAKHIVTTRDRCGNIKTVASEVKSPPKTKLQLLVPPPIDSGVGTQSPRPLDIISNIRTSVRRRLSFPLPDMPDDNLEDVSAPEVEGGLPSMSGENIEEMSMPSFIDASISPLQQIERYPSDYIDDCTPPSFGSSLERTPPTPAARRRLTYSRATPPLPNECLDEVSMPSMPSMDVTPQYDYQPVQLNMSPSPRRPCPPSPCPPPFPSPPRVNVMAPSPCPPAATPPRRQLSLPDECLEDMDEPSYDSSLSRHSPLPSEELTQVSMPSFLDCSISPLQQRERYPAMQMESFPSSNLDDMSEPCYESPPITPSPRTRRQELFDPEAPARSPCDPIENMSMPSFLDVTISPLQPHQCYPSDYLEDVSAPSFASSPARSPTPVRTPTPVRPRTPAPNAQRRLSFSPPSRAMSPARARSSPRAMSPCPCPHSASPPRRQVSLPDECLDDMNAPSYDSSLSRYSPLPSEELTKMSMPSFLDVSISPLQQHERYPAMQMESFPSSNLDDMSEPCYESPPRTPSPRTRRQELFDPAAPDRSPCAPIEEMSMPSFLDCSISPLQQQERYPSAYIDDCSPPSFGSSLERTPPPPAARRRLTYSHATPPLPNECLDDVSMPSMPSIQFTPQYEYEPLQLHSTPPRSPPRRLQTPTSLPNEFLDRISMPSSPRISPSPPRRRMSLPSENLDSLSAPSYNTELSRHSPIPSEELTNMSMPSFLDVSISPLQQHQRYPSDYLEDVSAPSYFSTASSSPQTLSPNARRKLEYSQPSPHSASNAGVGAGAARPSPQRQASKQDMPSGGTVDMTNESVYVSASMHSMSQQFSNIPADQIGNLVKSLSQQTVTLPSDISAPSTPAKSPPKLGGQPQRRNRSINAISDISAPSFPSSFASSTGSSSRRSPRRGGSGKKPAGSGGFAGMANYAPFEEQIRSRSGGNSPCDPNDPCCFQSSSICDQCPKANETCPEYRGGGGGCDGYGNRNRTC